jgi:AcrR family transcriptional regulator
MPGGRQTRPGDPVDGRHLRRATNRQQVVEAVLSLVDEGAVWPPAGEIAERAGVSMRSIFRYFDDLDDLWNAAVAASVERNGHLLTLPERAPTLAGRVEQMIDHQLAFHCTFAPLARALLTRSALSPSMDRMVRGIRRQRVLMIQEFFADDLMTLDAQHRRAAADTVVALLSHENLDLQLSKLHRSAGELRESLQLGLTAVLGASRIGVAAP